MIEAEAGVATRSVAILLVSVLVAAGLGVGLAVALHDGGGTTGAVTSPVRIPASDFRPYTWAYLGCSVTHDAIWGYHQAPGSAHLFWPFEAFPTEYMTVARWTNPADRHWQRFDLAKQRFDGGQDPPVVWFQLCENLQRGDDNYSGSASIDQVEKVLDILRQHAPSSVVFVSPLQPYDPPTLCPVMGPGGGGHPRADGSGEPGCGAGPGPRRPGDEGERRAGPPHARPRGEGWVPPQRRAARSGTGRGAAGRAAGRVLRRPAQGLREPKGRRGAAQYLARSRMCSNTLSVSGM